MTDQLSNTDLADRLEAMCPVKEPQCECTLHRASRALRSKPVPDEQIAAIRDRHVTSTRPQDMESPVLETALTILWDDRATLLVKVDALTAENSELKQHLDEQMLARASIEAERDALREALKDAPDPEGSGDEIDLHIIYAKWHDRTRELLNE